MRKGSGRLLALALCLLLALAACTQTEPGPAEFDAGAYVSGVLKAAYLGEFEEDYLEMVGITQAEAQAEYNNGVHMEVNNFYAVYGIESNSEELHEEIEELFHDIYSHASLTVTGVEGREDGSFLVTVEVRPLDIVRRVHLDMPAIQEKFYAKYPDSVQYTMTQEEYEAYDAEWAELVLGLYQEKLATISHFPVQTVTLRVEKDRQGYYGINNEDFVALDALVIDYTLPELQPQESPTPEESNPPEEGGEPEESSAPGDGDAVQTGGQPPESQPPASEGPRESVAPQESEKPSESPAPQESVDPNDPTPPTTGTPVPGLE